MKAVFSGIDTHPANSLALALRSVGYECVMLGDPALKTLRNKAYIGGVGADGLMSMGYVPPNMPYVGLDALDTADVFIDLKTKWLDSFKKMYPDMPVIHYLINGGADDYENCGFEYPVVTNNMWVQGEAFCEWLPFDNVHNLEPRMKATEPFEPPIGLIHNVKGWGFGFMVNEAVKELNLRIFGAGSPMGPLRNDRLQEIFAKTIANVHLKSNDCPGWALIETMYSGVPLVVPEMMLDRMRMRDMYENNVNCLTWGADFYEKEVTVKTGRVREWMAEHGSEMVAEIKELLKRLEDPEENYRIGIAGYERCKKLLAWTDDKRVRFANFLKNNGLPASV